MSTINMLQLLFEATLLITLWLIVTARTTQIALAIASVLWIIMLVLFLT